MLKWVQERAESYVSENWHSPLALLVASVVLAGGCIAFFARLDLTALSLLEWVFTGIAVGALSFVWWLTTRRVAKTPKGKLGFGVAISYEDARYGKELRQIKIRNLSRLYGKSTQIMRNNHIFLSDSNNLKLHD